jgi:anti-sigma factor RsiW
MKRCSDFDPLFTPFVDGQLDETERAGVEAHLEACPPCRDRAVAEQTVREVVRTRAEALAERASGALVARCAETQEPDARSSRLAGVFGRLSTPSRWVPLSAAATLLLAIGGVFVAGQNERLDAAFAAQMAIDHTRCFESSQLEPGLLSATAVEVSFQRDQGWNVAVPAVDGLELQDARRCEYAHGGMAHLLYRRDGVRCRCSSCPRPSGAAGTLRSCGMTR